MTLRSILLVGAAAAGLGIGTARADGQQGLFVQHLQANQVTLTSLGNLGGADGYLAKAPNNREQTLYVLPGGQYAVVGVLIGPTGENLTGKQLGEMQQRLDEARSQLQGASNSASSLASTVGALPGAVTDATATSPVLSLPVPPPAATAAPADTKPNHRITPADAAPWASKLDKATFLKEAHNTAWFDVWNPKVAGSSNARIVYMVADPQCPYCHMAWAHLKPLVDKGLIRLRVILVDILPGSDKLVPKLLSADSVSDAWAHGQGSEDGVAITVGAQPGSYAYSTASNYMDRNDAFFTKYEKGATPLEQTGTPLLAYTGRDGNLYSGEGPNDLYAFLGAL